MVGVDVSMSASLIQNEFTSAKVLIHAQVTGLAVVPNRVVESTMVVFVATVLPARAKEAIGMLAQTPCTNLEKSCRK